MKSSNTCDTAVIGAGVFGAWTAYHLRKAGQAVFLLDAYGPANSRASSGGESRIIRMGYGSDEIYTRSALRSLKRWEEFSRETQKSLFQRTGVLWLARADDPYSLATLTTLDRVGVRFERVELEELELR